MLSTILDAINLPGSGSGGSKEEIKVQERQVQTWSFLNQYVGRSLMRAPTFNHPPRRMPELIGTIPGKRRRCDKPRILAAIDTSGSMSGHELGVISGELQYLSKENEITVVECDYDIQKVYPYRGPILEVNGRGGTDFRPIFERNFLRKHDPDLIIYFTDGYGPVPDNSPKLPVVWIVSTASTPAPWGKVIRLG